VSRVFVGIDLGTTHCAMACAREGGQVEVLPVPQLVARAALDSRPLLASFCYAAHPSEGKQSLPWAPDRTWVVGEHARARGADAPGRVVSSAKSWLVHGGVDRRAPLLPVDAPEDVPKISPVEACRRYLEHLRETCAAHLGEADDVARAEVVLTVPASFDAAARDAGLTNVTLLEEPQAAVYAWIGAAGASQAQGRGVGDR